MIALLPLLQIIIKNQIIAVKLSVDCVKHVKLYKTKTLKRVNMDHRVFLGFVE